jgi:hypothetical protein
MIKLVFALIGLVLFGQSARPQITAPDSPAEQYRGVLDRYCVTCHNERLKTANLMLDKADTASLSAGAETWEKVIRKLRTGAMPPAGMPRPDKSTYSSFATYLETALDLSAAANPNPGRPAIHRLNRAEYANAIRDLLALDIDSESLLPSDDSSNGFDNIADVLSVSTVLLERYLSAARKIAGLAIGDAAILPVTETYSVPKYLTQNDRVSEALPFGSRGGIAIEHHFPLDGEYLIKIRLRRNVVRETVIGLVEPHQLDVWLDGARIKSFTVGGALKGEGDSPYSNRLQLQNPTTAEYLLGADAELEVRVPVKAGTRKVGVAFVKETWANETSAVEGLFDRQPALELRYIAFEVGGFSEPGVASVAISGPYNAKGAGETPSRKVVFGCRPTSPDNEEACARKILANLARRAYRRPVTDTDIQPLIQLYYSGHKDGGFEAGIRMALRKILVSLEFLSRIEREPAELTPGTAFRISDLELASRLSFFLWSTIPDDELLSVAEDGKLQNPVVLEQQVRRMLVDARSKALVDNFAGQWLYLRNLPSVAPDAETFPDFDDDLRQAFHQETELFFQSLLREDRSVLLLLDADYTFVNERLARHYGIPNIYGSHFRRIALADQNRRGLLGQGSILTVTSYATRTSPTLRGKWVLDNFLGTPPPPPPPNVPSLKDRSEDGRILSVREQLEQHRSNAVCASCHARMDPLGFALENFDAIGRWRTTSGVDGTPIDSSGVLLDGTHFQGAAELRKVLLGQPEQFVTTVAEKLLTYALGRGLEHYDQPAIRKIVRDAASDDYRWSSLIVSMIKSIPFQMRKSGDAAVQR